jgi:hypothetical protein
MPSHIPTGAQLPDTYPAGGENNWTPADAVSIWTTGPDATACRISPVMMQDLGDHVDIKLHNDRLAGSGLPADLPGCECLVSLDSSQVRDPDPGAGPDDSHYGTISNERVVGKHTIVSVPTTGPAAYIP